MRQAILVLGMHRSGTSALGGVLNALGAGAPKTLMAPHPENPRGFFESAVLADAHDALLASAGSSWHDWRQFNPKWFGSDSSERHRQEIKKLLINEFGNDPLIFIKDPRICRFVPFTLSVLSELNISPAAILPLRNPLEVAASLQRRDRDFSQSKSLLLWLRHVLDAEYHSRHLPRHFLSYETLLTDWRNEMNRTAKKIGVTWPARPEVSDAQIEHFLTGNLRRERSSVDELADYSGIMPLVRETYEALSEIVRSGESTALLDRLDRLRAALDESCRMFVPIVATEQSRAEQLQEELNRKIAELQNLDTKLEQRSLEANRLTAERNDLVHQLNQLATNQHALIEANSALAVERGNLVVELDRQAAQQRSSAEGHKVLVAERESLVAANDRLIAAQDAIFASHSWKVTAPLRSIRKWLSSENASKLRKSTRTK